MDDLVPVFVGIFFLPIFVGGGTGFVGRELIRLLKNKGHEVTLISRQPGPGKITWVRFRIIVCVCVWGGLSLCGPVMSWLLHSLSSPISLPPLWFRRGTWNPLDFHPVRALSIWRERTWWTHSVGNSPTQFLIHNIVNGGQSSLCFTSLLYILAHGRQILTCDSTNSEMSLLNITMITYFWWTIYAELIYSI